MTALTLLVILGAVGAMSKRVPAQLRWLAICGFSWMAASVAGFLLTGRAVDVLSARYLAPILLGLPWVACSAWALQTERWGRAALAVLTLLVFIHFTTAGWIGYGQYVSGFRPAITAWGRGISERRLLSEF